MFYLVCDGGEDTVLYFWKKNLYPDRVILSPEKLHDYVPYINGEDDILILIHGMTEFSLSAVYLLLSDIKILLDSDRLHCNNLVVASDVELPSVEIKYIKYKDVHDLFFDDKRDKEEDKIESGKAKKSNKADKNSKQAYLSAFFKYNSVNKSPHIVYGENKRVSSKILDNDFERLSVHIKRVVPQKLSKIKTEEMEG
jgi:hypothetical protein